MDAAVFLIAGYAVLLAFVVRTMRRAKARHAAERARDLADRNPVVYHGRKNRKGRGR